MLSSLLVFFLYVLSTTSLAVTASPLPQSNNGSTIELEGRAPPKKDEAQPDYLKNVPLQLGFQSKEAVEDVWGLILVGASGQYGNSCLFLRNGKLVSGSSSECKTDEWTTLTPLKASLTFKSVPSKAKTFMLVRRTFTSRPQCEYGGPAPADTWAAKKRPALLKPMSDSDFHGAISPDAIRFALRYFVEQGVYTGGPQEIPEVFQTMYKEKYRRVYEQQCGKTKEGNEVLDFLSNTEKTGNV